MGAVNRPLRLGQFEDYILDPAPLALDTDLLVHAALYGAGLKCEVAGCPTCAWRREADRLQGKR